jgi:hypothetical protein
MDVWLLACLLAAFGGTISARVHIGHIELNAAAANACLSVIGNRSRELRGWLFGGIWGRPKRGRWTTVFGWACEGRQLPD